MTEDDSKTLHSAIRDLCEEFIAARYTEELEYVPLLWDALRTRTNPAAPVRLGEWCAGLSFAAENANAFAAPFVLFTLEATLRELSDRGHAPDLARIGEAVRCAAEALGASVRLVAELVEDLPPRLAALFSASDGVLSLAQPKTGSGTRTGQLYIERRVDGHPRKPGWASKKVRTDNRKNIRYDIVVDEFARDLLIRKNRASTNDYQPELVRIDDIDPRVAAMLWCVLRHFGKTIDFKELRSRLNLRDSRTQDNAIHKAKSDLVTLLGERISKKLFGRSLHHRYSVRADGMNYCWMRATDNPQDSELLYRSGAPGE